MDVSKNRWKSHFSAPLLNYFAQAFLSKVLWMKCQTERKQDIKDLKSILATEKTHAIESSTNIWHLSQSVYEDRVENGWDEYYCLT